MKCEVCRAEMALKKVQKYQYVESGLENVFLDNLEVYFCADCSVEMPRLPKILALHNSIAHAIVLKPTFLSGEEVRFLRKSLRMKANEWANLLRTKKETFSRWENDGRTIGAQSDLLIRYLFVRLLEERNGQRFYGNIAESLAIIERVEEAPAIVIDVERIADFSYQTSAEIERSKTKAQEAESSTYLSTASIF